MLGALGAPKTLSTCAARLCCFGVLFVYLLVRSTMLDMFCLLKDVKIGGVPCLSLMKLGVFFRCSQDG